MGSEYTPNTRNQNQTILRLSWTSVSLPPIETLENSHGDENRSGFQPQYRFTLRFCKSQRGDKKN